MTKTIERAGSVVYDLIEEIGKVVVLSYQVMKAAFRRPLYLKELVNQMEGFGVRSLPVVLTTSLFTGAVLAVQTYIGFKRFSAESMVGTVVALSLTRELGPVVTGLIVAGRVGASMTAEIGTMRVTEQIDALITLSMNPVKYLIVPRVIAGFIMMPVLTLFADAVGIWAGFMVSIHSLGANRVVYIRRSLDFLTFHDVTSGLYKAAVFGIIIALIGCYKGFYTRGGAEGVGRATTGSVVVSSILILIANYVMTAVFFH
ncbi:MAG: MlaE family ABC transporter permease [bacterium]